MKVFYLSHWCSCNKTDDYRMIIRNILSQHDMSNVIIFIFNVKFVSLCKIPTIPLTNLNDNIG